VNQFARAICLGSVATGSMSKHSKNNSSKSVFTSHERSRALGIKSGTEKLRLGHDSMKPFDACSITLEPVVNPVADQQGHIYSKTAIYDHILEQKRLQEVQMKAYKKEQEQLKVPSIYLCCLITFFLFSCILFVSCIHYLLLLLLFFFVNLSLLFNVIPISCLETARIDRAVEPREKSCGL
jgi:hypothetical protein